VHCQAKWWLLSLLNCMARLNSEDFSKFFHMKAHTKKCRKMLKFFRKFENIHDFFDFFEVFHRKTFLSSELQLRAMHQKIPHKISHRTDSVTSLCRVVQKWFNTKNCQNMGFYAGWHCVGSLKIKWTYTKKYIKITGQLNIAIRHNFMGKHPRILVPPTQL